MFQCVILCSYLGTIQVIMHYIPRCHGNLAKIYSGYRLKDRSSRLDWDITETKKPLIVSGALKFCYIIPEYGMCERQQCRCQ